jgi:putative isomerase
LKLALVPLKGNLSMDAPWEEVSCRYINACFASCDSSGDYEFAIEEFITVWNGKSHDETFDECRMKVEDSFCKWAKGMLRVPDEFSEARQLTAYINWASVVKPSGHIKRDSMYMSKNWMINVYSWDHCFNAIALAQNDPMAAWDQLMVMFDHQDENGALPDSVNDRVVAWNFCKPPIHGWTLKWMMEKYGFDDPVYLEKIYRPLCRWTEWWFKYRDYDGDGIPQYNHGNDSGWDNATCYHAGAPLEAPDLAAYLIIQMEVLSKIAAILGREEEDLDWKSRADKLLNDLISHSWKGSGFVAPMSGTHTVFDSDSLYVYLPVILGKRLPEHILSHLVSGLKEKGRFLTDYGFATESIKSKYYETDGYWRGPIWAPSTMILLDGLVNAGEREFARDIAYRFCSMCKKSGMAENFNALTGEALRDHAYTWTASVFLILANEFLS